MISIFNQVRLRAMLFGLVICVSTGAQAGEAQLRELDAFWSEVARTVSAGDFEAYGNTYHPDAVLVSLARGKSYPIATALKGWEQGFVDTEAGHTRAMVEFRFLQRLHDETTAHETGIFHYRADSGNNEAVDQYVHFEALLVRQGEWKMIMEYQRAAATPEEWAAAK